MKVSQINISFLKKNSSIVNGLMKKVFVNKYKKNL